MLCFVLTLSCLRAGWVICFGGVWGSTCGGENFYWICRLLICNFTGYMNFLKLFFMHFAEADYLLGFYVDRYPGRKRLIVTWRQIYNCGMTRENMCMGDRKSIHMHVCIYVCTRTCVSVCMWLFTCAFVHMHQNNFNCILTIACRWA